MSNKRIVMTEPSEVTYPPSVLVDDQRTESASGEWSPVEPSPVPPEDYVAIQHDVRVIKANVQFLLDRVLVMEQHIERLIEESQKRKDA